MTEDIHTSEVLGLKSGAQVWCEGPIGELVGDRAVSDVDDGPHYRLMVSIPDEIPYPVPFAWHEARAVRKTLRRLLSEDEVTAVWEGFALESRKGMVLDKAYVLRKTPG